MEEEYSVCLRHIKSVRYSYRILCHEPTRNHLVQWNHCTLDLNIHVDKTHKMTKKKEVPLIVDYHDNRMKHHQEGVRSMSR